MDSNVNEAMCRKQQNVPEPNSFSEPKVLMQKKYFKRGCFWKCILFIKLETQSINLSDKGLQESLYVDIVLLVCVVIEIGGKALCFRLQFYFLKCNFCELLYKNRQSLH